MIDLGPAVDVLAPFERILVFSGAGISTESGIPDFRGPDGLWTKVDPDDFTIERYIRHRELRVRSWRMHARGELWGARSQVAPNRAHLAVVDLHRAGRLAGCVTQNIDGLHQVAGLPPATVAEVHGNVRTVVCLGCASSSAIEATLQRVDAGEEDPSCLVCGGMLKTSTVMFGEILPEAELHKAWEFAGAAGAAVVVGSTVGVYPAAAIPMTMAAEGKPMIIVNQGPTEADLAATIRLEGAAGDILPPLFTAVTGRSGGVTLAGSPSPAPGSPGTGRWPPGRGKPEERAVIRGTAGPPPGSVNGVDTPLTPLGLDHVDAVHDLVRRWEAHWKVPLVTPRSEILDDFQAPGFVPELDTRGVWLDDRLVAFGTVSHTVSGTRQERAILAGQVDPEARGNGLGRRLLAWQIERATERLRRCDPTLPWYIRAYQWDWIEESHRLYRRFGLEPVRWFEDLVRPLADLPPVAVPPGVEIVPWEEAPTDSLRQASNESFSDHWGSTPRNAESWRHLVESTSVRRDLSLAALSEGRVVGLCLNAHFADDAAVTGRIDGWIEVLGVVRAWRRKGVASALIASSLETFRAAGFTHAMIGVDADNLSGASGLYRGLGFEPLHRTVTSELQVHHSAGLG